ncbi:hypothetical protein HK103_007546 [Boothiomyces macroporosus]|uniref:Glutathione S-transferase n=1 Tax=Boothiomyces macroporosus TaxID=261099 RepID=A0AAD5UC34_9FUNG|nr:hypothetical protein HK103_007546 [Boothiomyces macroporosus]
MLILFAYTSRSRAERVVWVLNELGLEYKIIRLNYANITNKESPEYKQLSLVNPNLKVPVLVHAHGNQEFILTESLAICQYLYKLKSRDLLSDPKEEARLYERIYFCVSEIESNLWMLDQSIHIKRYDLNTHTIDNLIQVVQNNISTVERWIEGYACGNTFTLLDVLCYHLLTWASMYSITINEKTREYLALLESRPSCPELMKRAGSHTNIM